MEALAVTFNDEIILAFIKNEQCAPNVEQFLASDTYRSTGGKAATDSRRPRPNRDNGTFDIVTTECRRPDGWGACDNVAKNSASCLWQLRMCIRQQQEITCKKTWWNLISWISGGV